MNQTFENIRIYSPIENQSMLWMAEYSNHDIITEFDLKTKRENPFSIINQKDVMKFGIIGNGTKLYFNKALGDFRIFNNSYKIKFLADNTLYDLISNETDLITYKRAEAILNQENPKSNITGYYFGYHCNIQCDSNHNIDFKPIFCLTKESPLYIEINIKTNLINTKNKIVIITNNTNIEYIDLPYNKSEHTIKYMIK